MRMALREGGIKCQITETQNVATHQNVKSGPKYIKKIFFF